MKTLFELAQTDEPTGTSADEARLGLVEELLQVVLGLEPETMDRVMRTIRGSEDSADIRTPEMRQRIGPRAMRYLRNAIDIARNEGNEYHDDDPDADMSKEPDLEPGHKHDHVADDEMKEGFTFKEFLLNEVRVSIDTEDPDALTQAKRAIGKDPDRVTREKRVQAQQGVSDAQRLDPNDPNAAQEKAVAMDRKRLVDKEARLERARQQQQKQQGQV